ncbi:MAG: hypothetical protein K6C99_08990 [Lachnospiraceae bacterium]|nr:hypothetical protein [Lachnospiraceae bacterium]
MKVYIWVTGKDACSDFKGVMNMPINVSGSSNISTLFSSLNNTDNKSSANDVSAFFGSAGNNNGVPSVGFDLSTYSALKNGTYRKVMNKYFNTKPQATEEDIKKATAKIERTADAAGDVVGSFNKLSDLSLAETDREKNVDKIEDFIKKYNSLVEHGEDSIYDNVAQKTKWMENITDESSNLLASAGISAGSDGKLTLDKDKFMKADEDTLNDLFKGSSSWAGKVEYKAEQIYSLALTGDTSANSYTNAATYGKVRGSSYNTTV